MGINRTYSTSYRLRVAGLSLAIFVLYFANISLFTHCHVINGVTIVHSHIHTDDHTEDPFDSEAHTDNELTLIQNISNYISELAGEPLSINVILTKTDFTFIIVDKSVDLNSQYSTISLRGPPAILS